MDPGERFNTGSHLIGLLLALGSAAALISRLRGGAGLATMVGPLTFAAAAIALYAASTLYHASRGRLKALCERADHCAIYLLIAGTYTPFALLSSPSFWHGASLALLWAMAVWAIWRELRPARATEPTLWLYLGMGWLGVLGVATMAAQLSRPTIAWLLAGAACYTLGTLFYARLRRWPHAHGVWHCCVLGGTACHYVSVALLLP